MEGPLLFLLFGLMNHCCSSITIVGKLKLNHLDCFLIEFLIVYLDFLVIYTVVTSHGKIVGYQPFGCTKPVHYRGGIIRDG